MCKGEPSFTINHFLVHQQGFANAFGQSTDEYLMVYVFARYYSMGEFSWMHRFVNGKCPLVGHTGYGLFLEDRCDESTTREFNQHVGLFALLRQAVMQFPIHRLIEL